MRAIILVFLVFVNAAKGQNYTPVNEAEAVKFTIENIGFDVNGGFGGIKGSVVFDAKNLGIALFDVTVDASTVNTKNSTRDKHLRGPDYFAVQTYPQIRLTSVKIAKSVTPGFYVFFGKLTIKETTKDISFPFKVIPEAGAYRFKGEFTIQRRDFGVGGKSTVSNDLKVKLNVLTKK
ncbi:MAG: YceI family protein [Lacibacter sp.]|nr:YceI family protein [Lacibacter sp.]